MPGSKANTLKKALNSLDLDSEEPNFFEDYYVKRKNSYIVNSMKALIVSKKNQTSGVKILFSGHRGSGKSTELHYLQHELEKEGFLVIFVAAIKDLHHVPDVFYTDIFLLLMSKIYEIIENLSIKLDKKLLRNLESLLKQLAGESSVTITTQKRKGWQIGALFASIFKIGGELSRDYNRKEVIRKKADTLIGEITALFNEIVSSIEKTTNKKVVIIIDDLEKLTDHQKISDFLLGHGAYIESLTCCIVLTIPPSLYHSGDYAHIARAYSSQFLPLLQVRDHQGNLDEQEIGVMHDLVKRRVSESLMPETIVRVCAIQSGGLITDFLRLLKDGCVKAIAQQRESLNQMLLEASFHQLVLDFNANLESKYYPKLVSVFSTKSVDDDADKIVLLFRLAILEYLKPQGLPWHDTHPAVDVLLRWKGLLAPPGGPEQK